MATRAPPAAAMTEYPRSQPRRLEGHSGEHTPSHGGTVNTGYEYELVPNTAAAATAAHDFVPVLPSTRPGPVSTPMPPQAYVQQPTSTSAMAAAAPNATAATAQHEPPRGP